MFYSTTDRKIISNALRRQEGRFVGGASNPYCGAVSPTFTAKWVPPDSDGGSRGFENGPSPAQLADEAREVRHGPLGDTNEQAELSLGGEKRKSWRTRLLDGPSEREDCPGG